MKRRIKKRIHRSSPDGESRKAVKLNEKYLRAFKKRRSRKKLKPRRYLIQELDVKEE